MSSLGVVKRGLFLYGTCEMSESLEHKKIAKLKLKLDEFGGSRAVFSHRRFDLNVCANIDHSPF